MGHIHVPINGAVATKQLVFKVDPQLSRFAFHPCEHNRGSAQVCEHATNLPLRKSPVRREPSVARPSIPVAVGGGFFLARLPPAFDGVSPSSLGYTKPAAASFFAVAADRSVGASLASGAGEEFAV